MQLSNTFPEIKILKIFAALVKGRTRENPQKNINYPILYRKNKPTEEVIAKPYQR